jgi:hypothetical protein
VIRSSLCRRSRRLGTPPESHRSYGVAAGFLSYTPYRDMPQVCDTIPLNRR